MTFHEELIEARRRGEMLAPPTTSEPTEARKAEDLLVVFHPAPYDGLSTCGRCLALITTEHAPSHRDWHHQNGH